MNTKKFRRLLSVFLSVVMCAVMLPVETARAENTGSAERFTDVLPGHWYYPAIEFVVANGYFNGVSETSFAPDAPMSRAMFVTVLGRYAGVEDMTEKNAASVFVDVAPDSYFCGYVGWAVENGIVQGFSESVFGYAEEVTREQTAVFLYRYAQLIGLDVSVEQTASPSTFNGGSNASPWALKAMVWAMSRGIMTGVGNDLDPQAVVSRAQVAQILMNFDRYAGE